MNLLMILLGVVIIYTLMAGISFPMFYKKAKPGELFLRTGMGGYRVSKGGMFVIPTLHSYVVLDDSVKRIRRVFTLNDSELNPRKIEATLFIKLNSNSWEDIVLATEFFSAENTSNEEILTEYFSPKLEDSLQRISGKYLWENIIHRSVDLKSDVLQDLGDDLNGFIVDDLLISPSFQEQS